MKPGYPTTVYEDADMFLPYDEINLPKGVYNLKLDIDVTYEDGELIQHLTFKPLSLRQPAAAPTILRQKASARRSTEFGLITMFLKTDKKECGFT